MGKSIRELSKKEPVAATNVLPFPARTMERLPSMPSFNDAKINDQELDLVSLLSFSHQVDITIWEDAGRYDITDSDGNLIWEIRRIAA